MKPGNRMKLQLRRAEIQQESARELYDKNNFDTSHQNLKWGPSQCK
jgi:hypothetical protein